MNEQNMISEELDHAGEVSTVTPSLLELDGYRITSETDAPNNSIPFYLIIKLIISPYKGLKYIKLKITRARK